MTPAIICPQCEKKNIEGSTECENCGTDISHLWRTRTVKGVKGPSFITDKLTDVGGNRSVALQVPPDLSVREVVKQMRENDKCSVVVVGEEGTVEGIFTERSLVMRVCNESPINLNMPVKEAMLNKPVILNKKDSLAIALHHMHLGEYTYAIIQDDPIRVVNIRDILSYFVEHPSHNGFA